MSPLSVQGEDVPRLLVQSPAPKKEVLRFLQRYFLLEIAVSLPGEQNQAHIVVGAVGKGALQVILERLADSLLLPLLQPCGQRAAGGCRGAVRKWYRLSAVPSLIIKRAPFSCHRPLWRRRWLTASAPVMKYVSFW